MVLILLIFLDCQGPTSHFLYVALTVMTVRQGALHTSQQEERHTDLSSDCLVLQVTLSAIDNLLCPNCSLLSCFFREISLFVRVLLSPPQCSQGRGGCSEPSVWFLAQGWFRAPVAIPLALDSGSNTLGTGLWQQ